MWPFRKAVEEGEAKGLADASLSQPPGSSSWFGGVLRWENIDQHRELQ